MAIHTTINIISLNAYIFQSRTTISPPFGWSKQSDNRRPSGNRDMRRTCISSNINTRAACQRIEPFTTVALKGVSYSFSGRFLKGGVYSSGILDDETPVLVGTLTKFRNGHKQAEAKLKFVYFGGT